MAEAWPYRLFVLVGGARANMGLLGEDAGEWMQILKRGMITTGTDDPTTLNTWAENQYRLKMGLEPLQMPSDQSQLAGSLMADSPASLLG